MRKQIHSSISYFSLFLIAITLPLHMHINSVAIAIATLNWIVEGDFKLKLRKIITTPWIIISTSFYLLHIIGLLYTNNQADGSLDIEKKLAIFLIPIIATSFPVFNKNIFEDVMKAFIISCLIVSLLCFSKSMYDYFLFHDSSVFFYYRLIDIVDFHPVYFSNFIAFCIFFLLYRLINQWKEYNPLKKSILLVLVIYFLLFFILLSARTSFFVFILIVIGYFIYFFIKSKEHRLLLAITSFIFCISIVGVISKSSFLKNRFKDVLHPNLHGFTLKDTTSAFLHNNGTGLTLRLMKWKCSLLIIKEYPFIGVGTGDTEDELQQCYGKIGLWEGQYRFNAHNQFFQTWIGLGTIGFIFILIYLFYPLRVAIKEKQHIFIIFSLLFISACLTESMLCRQKGVLFYTFFISWFLVFYQKKDKN